MFSFPPEVYRKISEAQSLSGLETVEDARSRLLSLIEAWAEADHALSLRELNRRFGSSLLKKFGVSLRSLIDSLHEEGHVLMVNHKGKNWVCSAHWLSERVKDLPPEEQFPARESLLKLWIKNGEEV